MHLNYLSAYMYNHGSTLALAGGEILKNEPLAPTFTIFPLLKSLRRARITFLSMWACTENCSDTCFTTFCLETPALFSPSVLTADKTRSWKEQPLLLVSAVVGLPRLWPEDMLLPCIARRRKLVSKFPRSRMRVRTYVRSRSQPVSKYPHAYTLFDATWHTCWRHCHTLPFTKLTKVKCWSTE